MNLAWESEESELKALRDLVNQLKSGRAFEVSRRVHPFLAAFLVEKITVIIFNPPLAFLRAVDVAKVLPAEEKPSSKAIGGLEKQENPSQLRF